MPVWRNSKPGSSNSCGCALQVDSRRISNALFRRNKDLSKGAYIPECPCGLLRHTVLRRPLVDPAPRGESVSLWLFVVRAASGGGPSRPRTCGKARDAYVPGGVDVPAQAETATPAPIDSGSERHRLAMPAPGAIGAGMGRAHLRIRDTSFLGFVSQYEVEGTPPLFRHLLGVSAGAEQSRNVEVLDGYAVEGSNEVVGQAEVRRPGSLGFPAPDPGHSGPLLDPGPCR